MDGTFSSLVDDALDCRFPELALFADPHPTSTAPTQINAEFVSLWAIKIPSFECSNFLVEQ
jgi:hypothetical protein